jgi:AAA+ superfamily predicted ATPase
MPKPKSKPSDSANAVSLSETSQQIIHYLRAGYPGLYIVSPEEQRVEAEFQTIAQHLKFTLSAWSVVDGLVDVDSGQSRNFTDPLEVLEAVAELKERSILLLKDFHLFLTDPNPLLLRKFKDCLLVAKTRQTPLIILGCRLCLPPELERELTVIEYQLPDKEALKSVYHGIMASAGITSVSAEDQAKAAEAACGLTTMEAENAFALSVVKTKTICPVVVAREKAQALKKNGLLEIVETKESLESIGGLDCLKQWLIQRRQAFTPKAAQYRLPVPKGLLIIGIPGTGKSLTAKATAQVFGVPLLKLDAGRIFGGLVGQSEANLRTVIQTAEAIAPCCLWIDELEKAFSGVKSGSTDGGTSSRVFGSLINWLQEKTKPVFVVATANDISQLPPELLRKGRFDEIFFVDLPQHDERVAIWDIIIERAGRAPGDYDLDQLARATEGLTGSEIEAVFVEALFTAFSQDREPRELDIATMLNGFVPLARTMAEPIRALRQWSTGRARPATSPISSSTSRKLAV